MKNIDFLVEKANKKEKILLMFDYDGTLTPIVDKPENALLDKQIKNDIDKLVNCDFIKVAIISGRQIAVIKELSALNNPKIDMYGIHGGEVYLNGNITSNMPEFQLKTLNKFKTKLNTLLSTIDGLIFEDKKYSIAMHYRLANEDDANFALKTFRQEVKNFELEKDFKYQEGKKVLEIIPQNFNKGNAVNSLVNKYSKYFPVYFGDDLTDIAAFNKVKEFGGMAIGVEDRCKNFNCIDVLISINDIKNFFKVLLTTMQ